MAVPKASQMDALLGDDDALPLDNFLALVDQDGPSALADAPDGPGLRGLAAPLTVDGVVLSSVLDLQVSTELSEFPPVGHTVVGSIVESGRGSMVVAQHESAGEASVAFSGVPTSNALALHPETQVGCSASGGKGGGTNGVEIDYLLLQLLGPMDLSGVHEHQATSCTTALEAASSEASDASSERHDKQNEELSVKPRRRRKRQSDELLYPKRRVFGLEGKLAELQKRGACPARNTGGNPGAEVALPPSSSKESWERIASYQKGQKCIAILENLRLRARHENQLQVARSLEALYHNQTSFAVRKFAVYRHLLSRIIFPVVSNYHTIRMLQIMEPSLDVNGFLYKRPRNEPLIDDDAMVFASLGQGLDARYTQTDTIFDATGLSYIDHEMMRGMYLKRDERGQLCLEHLETKLLPFDSRVIDRVFWECASRKEFRKHHGVYQQVRLATEDTISTKMVDPLQLSHAEIMTLTICTAMKRFIEADRVVAVWEALVTTSGLVSVRLRESGWNILRPTPARIPHHTGPVSIIQTCGCFVPELQRAHSEQDLAVGTLTNLIVRSYHRHKETMHQISEDLLAAQFGAFCISN